MTKKYSEFIKEVDPNLFGVSADVWDNIGESIAADVAEADAVLSAKQAEAQKMAEDIATMQIKQQQLLVEQEKAKQALEETQKTLQAEQGKKQAIAGIAEKQQSTLDVAIKQAQDAKARYEKFNQETQTRIAAIEQNAKDMLAQAAAANESQIKVLQDELKKVYESLNEYEHKFEVAQADKETLAQQITALSNTNADILSKNSALAAQIDAEGKRLQLTLAKINQIGESEGLLNAKDVAGFIIGDVPRPTSVSVKPNGIVELTLDGITYGPEQIQQIASAAVQSLKAHGVDPTNAQAIQDFLSGWITENEKLKKQISEQQSAIVESNEAEILVVDPIFEEKMLDMMDAFFQDNISEAVKNALPENIVIDTAKMAVYQKILENVRSTIRLGDINIVESASDVEGLRKQLEESRLSEESAKRDMFKAKAEAIVESRIAQMPTDTARYVRPRVKDAANPGEAETKIEEALNAFERERAEVSRSNLHRKSPLPIARVDEHQITPSQENQSDDVMSLYTRASQRLTR